MNSAIVIDSKKKRFSELLDSYLLAPPNSGKLIVHAAYKLAKQLDIKISTTKEYTNNFNDIHMIKKNQRSVLHEYPVPEANKDSTSGPELRKWNNRHPKHVEHVLESIEELMLHEFPLGIRLGEHEHYIITALSKKELTLVSYNLRTTTTMSIDNFNNCISEKKVVVIDKHLHNNAVIPITSPEQLTDFSEVYLKGAEDKHIVLKNTGVGLVLVGSSVIDNVVSKVVRMIPSTELDKLISESKIGTIVRDVNDLLGLDKRLIIEYPLINKKDLERIHNGMEIKLRDGTLGTINTRNMLFNIYQICTYTGKDVFYAGHDLIKQTRNKNNVVYRTDINVGLDYLANKHYSLKPIQDKDDIDAGTAVAIRVTATEIITGEVIEKKDDKIKIKTSSSISTTISLAKLIDCIENDRAFFLIEATDV
jgi:hypothetical protein